MKLSPNELSGEWKLINSILRNRSGHALSKDPFEGANATIVYGINPNTIAVQAQTVDGGYYAYSGQYTLKENVIIHHIDQATHEAYIGQDLQRSIKFCPAASKDSADKLILTSYKPENVLGDDQLLFHEASWIKQFK